MKVFIEHIGKGKEIIVIPILSIYLGSSVVT